MMRKMMLKRKLKGRQIVKMEKMMKMKMVKMKKIMKRHQDLVNQVIQLPWMMVLVIIMLSQE